MQHTKMDFANAESNMLVVVNGEEHWIPAIAYPFFTTKGLPFWKRFNEKNWRPQCDCGRIFDSLDDYNAHVVYWNSVYGKAELEAREAKNVS